MLVVVFTADQCGIDSLLFVRLRNSRHAAENRTILATKVGSLVLVLVVIDGYYRPAGSVPPGDRVCLRVPGTVQLFFAANAVKPERQVPGLLSVIG